MTATTQPRPRPREPRPRPQPTKPAKRQPINELDRRNRELIARFRAGDEAALASLCLANRGLVWNIADKIGRDPGNWDYFQAGMLGLLRATRDYDPDSYGFATYATYCIRSAVKRAVWYDRLIRVPIQHCRPDVPGEKPPLYRQEALRALSASSFRPIDHEHEDDPRWLVEVDDELEARLKAARLEERKLRTCLKSLPEREAEIIRLRYGLGCEPLTCREVGELMGVSKQRVAEIQARAIKRLRERMEARR